MLVAHIHAAPQTLPVTYTIPYKRSILGSPNPGLEGLTGLNSYSGPLNFGFGQGLPSAYSPTLSNYGFGDLRLHQTRDFSSPADFQYSQYSSPLNFGFDATNYPFSAPLQFGSPALSSSPQFYSTAPNVIHQVPALQQFKTATMMISAKAPSVQSYVTPQLIQTGAQSHQQPNVYEASNGHFTNPNTVAPGQQYPAIQDDRQVRLLKPPTAKTMESNADQTYQIPSSYQPISTSDSANTAPTSGFAAGSEAVPSLILELRPPLHSAMSFDYSKNSNPSSSDHSSDSFVDYSSASGGSNFNQAPGQNQNAAAYAGNSNPLHVNQYREAHSLNANAYTVPVASISNGAPSNSIQNAFSVTPSVSYSMASDSYHQPDPISINNYFSSSGSDPVSPNNAPKSVTNNVVSNNLYTESDSSSVDTYSTRPVPVSSGTNTATNTFANDYYNNPPPSGKSTTYQNSISNVSFGSNSNPISANSYSDSNLIQSGSYNAPSSFGHSKLDPMNIYSDSNSISNNNKRESSNNVSQLSKPHLNYFSSIGNYNKNEERT